MAYNIFTLPQGVAYNATQAAQQKVPQRPAMPVTFGNTPVGQVLQNYIPQSAVQTDAQAAAQQQHPGVAIANKALNGGYQPATTWHGKDAMAPDGGIYSWMGRTFTTPQQEQKYRKQSRARMGIMAVADALRHLGNIYHTTQYAPSQQFNKPVEQEYAMYKANKAERDKDNYAIYQQQLAQAKWEADQAYKQATLGWRAKDYAIKERAADRADAKAKQDQENWLKTFEANQGWRDYQKERQTKMDDNTIRHQKVMESQGQQGLAIRWANLQETKAQHAWTRQHSGAGGDGKQKVFFTGTYGSVSRNQGMSLDESVNMVNNLHRMGWVTDKKYNEFMSAIQGGNEANMYSVLYGGAGAGGKGATGGIIEGVLTYHKDGAKWLQDNYNFNISGPGTGVPAKVTRVTRKPAQQAAPQKPAAAPQKPAAKDTTIVKASSSTQAAAQKATTPKKQAAGGQKATQNGGSTPKNGGKKGQTTGGNYKNTNDLMKRLRQNSK